MTRRARRLVLAAAVLLATAPAPSARADDPVFWPPWLRDKPHPVTYPELVVTPQWLAERLGRAGVQVLDLRERPRARERIPGAVGGGERGFGFPGGSDLRTAAAGYGRRLAESLGLRADDLIVCCTDSSTAAGARDCWLLELAGARNVRVLEGGFAAWRGAGLPVEPAAPRAAARPPAAWDAAPDTSRIVDAAWLGARLGRGDLELLDARGRGFGDTPTALDAPSSAWREGHLPNSLPVDFTAFVTGGSLRPAEIVRTALARVGPRPGTTVNADAEFVVYDAGGGDDAALGYLLLRLAGFRARLYPGGWRDWAADGARPFVRVLEAPELQRRLGPAACDSTSPPPDVPPRGFALLDVRQDLDWTAGHIPGAVNVMAHQLEDSLDVAMARAWPDLPRDAPVVVYCYGPECIRSRVATTLLARRGWSRPEWFRGGLPAWRKAGGTVIRGPSRP